MTNSIEKEMNPGCLAQDQLNREKTEPRLSGPRPTQSRKKCTQVVGPETKLIEKEMNPGCRTQDQLNRERNEHRLSGQRSTQSGKKLTQVAGPKTNSIG